MEEREVIIVGGGPAGLSAAIFTQFDGWSTLVLEGSWVGGQGAIAYTVSNYPGFPPGDGAMLMENMEKQVTSTPPAGVAAELRRERVVGLNAEDRIVATEVNQYKGQTIILATGSTMQKLGVLGEDSFAGKGVSYYAKRDVNQFGGKRVLVVGGGNTTAKSALLAKTVASEVTLIHRKKSLRTYPVMTKRLQKEEIQIWYNTELKEIKCSDRVETAVLVNNKTGEQKEIAVDWIVICVGTEPDTRLAQEAGLEMTGAFLIINKKMMTSKPGIFACGEITGSERHLITAASEGTSTGMAVSEYLALEKVKRGEMFEGARMASTLTSIWRCSASRLQGKAITSSVKKKHGHPLFLILNLNSEDRTVLQTNLKHLETDEETQEALKNNENVVICCGRMGPMCTPVYAILNQLETRYPHVRFYDQDFDIPAAGFIRRLSECTSFMGLPFTVYFTNSKVVAATTSIQNGDQISKILDREFGQHS